MNTNCTDCPTGTTTILPAAGGRDECGMKCSPGTYSENGVEPCIPCAKGSFQNSVGALACEECTAEKSTYGPGADAADMCVVIDDCASKPCNNGGTCTDLKDDVICDCPSGYSGKFCEIENDECLSDPCYQGATCVDKVNGYECVCETGFTGRQCDVPSQVCGPNVCQNGAKCLVQPPDFACECLSGYGGKFCEMKTDHCASSPCRNHAECRSLTESYQCSCRPGYEGVQCEINTDECTVNPCMNNGTCTDGENRYTCNCRAGFTGSQCEININECLLDPCKNGGQCVDMIDGYECICKPTYFEANCTKKLCQNFDLSFPLRVATSSSSVQNIPDMHAFTIAFWLRTDDKENPGTPLSYANMVGGKLQDNALVIQDYGAFELHINNKKLFIGTSANDGKWHHVAVTWDSNGGKWIFYKDGKEVKRYTEAFLSGAVIHGGGVMVLGQEQDSLGGSFSPEEAFSGDLSQLNVWDKVLSPQDIYNLVRSCFTEPGNVKAWADFRTGLQGVYVLTKKSHACNFTSPLRRFSWKRDMRLSNNNGEVLTGKTAEQCAFACEQEVSFPCRSLDYDRTNGTCYLSSEDSEGGVLTQAKGYDFYQMSCTEALGVQSKVIPDSAMTASSSLSSISQPSVARLYAPQASGIQGVVDSRGGWSPQLSDQEQYLQINLGVMYKITGVATQGGDGLSEWVSSYKLQYSVDGNVWQYYGAILSGNADSDTVVKRELQSLTAEMIRFRPQTWNGKITMRVEVFGCLADPIPQPPYISGIAEINECSSNNPCKNGGRCYDLHYGFRCKCSPQYEGSTCEKAKACSDPGTPLHGYKSSSSYNHGSTIAFSCKAGFSLQGSASRTCYHGLWSGTKAECKDIDECTSGHCAQGCANTIGSFICSCNPGYTLNNNRKTCDDVNECSLGLCSHICHNSAGTFRCSCPSGMELAPGGRFCRDKDECASNNGGCQHLCVNRFLSHACYCRGGYTIAADGKNCNEKRCPPINAPASGVITMVGDAILGNIATFICNAGYQLVGSQKRLCAADGQWSGVQPTCNAGRCVEVGTVKYGTRTGTGTSYGTSVSFSCNSGYDLVGSTQRTCQENGVWSSKQPRCVRADCPQLSPPAHGNVEGYRREIDSAVRVSCDEGYNVYPDSSSFRTCLPNKQWSGADPICKLKDCGDPGTPWHGYLHGFSFVYNSTVMFSCRPLHHLEGDKERTCQANGQWSGQQPKCLERSCGNPGAPTNGIKIGTNHSYGASVQLACYSGYTLVGSQKRTCQNTGQWSGTQPSCQIVACGDPGALTNGFRIGDKFTYGESVIYDCDAGFKLQGSIIRKCEMNGQWSGTAASCNVSNCGSVLHGPSGTFQSSNFPNNYLNNEYCTWKIQVPQGKKVRLEFEELRTEENKDFVLLYDTDKTDPIIAFSGIKDKPRAITSSGNSIRVKFISNGENVNNGFKVSYKQTDCGGILDTNSGELRSPGFPNGYPPNLSCTWLIFIANKQIGLTINEFKTENAYDRLEVAHGPWVTAPLEIAWSGPSPLSGQVVTNQYMWVHFLTSAQDNGLYKGFRATFRPYVPYTKRK